MEEEEEERSRVRLDKEEMGKEEIIEEEEQKLVDYDSARRRFLSESASAAGEIIMVIVVMMMAKCKKQYQHYEASNFLNENFRRYFSEKNLQQALFSMTPYWQILKACLADSKSLFSSDSLFRIEVGLFCREHPCTWQIRKRTGRALW